MIVALFVGGLKLRLPLRHPAWVAAYRSPVMLASILGVALCAHLLLGLDPAMALLAGAVLAPTDPVLASMVRWIAPPTTTGCATDYRAKPG